MINIGKHRGDAELDTRVYIEAVSTISSAGDRCRGQRASVTFKNPLTICKLHEECLVMVSIKLGTVSTP